MIAFNSSFANGTIYIKHKIILNLWSTQKCLLEHFNAGCNTPQSH